MGKVKMVRKMHPHASPVKAVAYSVDGKEHGTRASMSQKFYTVWELHVVLYFF